jgi:hypothetical protein
LLVSRFIEFAENNNSDVEVISMLPGTASQ